MSDACTTCPGDRDSGALSCSACGLALRHRTWKEAYSFRSGGLGLVDVTPGVRDLPRGVRLALMMVLITALVWLIT